MGGKVWSSEELDTLELLAGDVPWPALPQTYWNTVRQHGYPRRTATALRRKCNDLGLQRAAIGRWVNAGLICKLMEVSYEAVQTWMRNGLIEGKRFGETKGHRYYFTRASLRALARTHPHLFGGLPISNLTQLFDDPPSPKDRRPRPAEAPAASPRPLRRDWHHLPLDQRSSPRRLRHPQVHLRRP
jgi:DNA-binding transcriptional MerR regulator